MSNPACQGLQLDNGRQDRHRYGYRASEPDGEFERHVIERQSQFGHHELSRCFGMGLGLLGRDTGIPQAPGIGQCIDSVGHDLGLPSIRGEGGVTDLIWACRPIKWRISARLDNRAEQSVGFDRV